MKIGNRFFDWAYVTRMDVPGGWGQTWACSSTSAYAAVT